MREGRAGVTGRVVSSRVCFAGISCSRVNGNNNRRFISGLRFTLPIFYSHNLAISIQWNEACFKFNAARRNVANAIYRHG